jgi:hygromycin-B 4-O-kinase
MHIDPEQLQHFLSTRFKWARDPRHLADGWWSQAFSFSSDEGELVIRISRNDADFRKDLFASQHFSNPHIPVPVCKEIGRFDDSFYYCLSAFCEGRTSDSLFEELSPAAQQALAPAVLAPLEHIHRLDTSGLTGWGITDTTGKGGWNSWPDFLAAVHNHKHPVTWQQLARNTWLDGRLFERLLERMRSLFPFLPEKKMVLHGDYGFDNLLIKDGRVTAVLDWAEMMLGDEVYDLVHMNEPWAQPNGEMQYLPLWAAGKELPHLEERLLCYRIHYSLLHMHIYTVHVQDEETYTQIAQWAQAHLL